MSRKDVGEKMTAEQSAAFMEAALKAQIAVLKRSRDPSLPPVTYTDADGDTHEIDGFVSLIHTPSGNLFQGYRMNDGRLFSLLDTVIGTVAERDPDMLKQFLSMMIMQYLPDSVSPELKKSYELLQKITAIVTDDDDSKTNEGETK